MLPSDKGKTLKCELMVIVLLFCLKMHFVGVTQYINTYKGRTIKVLAPPPYHDIYIIYLNMLPYILVFNMFLAMRLSHKYKFSKFVKKRGKINLLASLDLHEWLHLYGYNYHYNHNYNILIIL